MHQPGVLLQGNLRCNMKGIGQLPSDYWRHGAICQYLGWYLPEPLHAAAQGTLKHPGVCAKVRTRAEKRACQAVDVATCQHAVHVSELSLLVLSCCSHNNEVRCVRPNSIQGPSDALLTAVGRAGSCCR